MQAPYQIAVSNERYKFLIFFKWSAAIANIICYVLVGLYTQKGIGPVFQVCIAAFTLLHLYPFKNARLQKLFNNGSWGVYMCIPWIVMHDYIIAFLVLILCLFSSTIKKWFVFSFTTEKIVIDTFPSKKINWSSLQNALLKDGLLTLDFKNNHLIQVAAEPKFAGFVDETEFNEFCRQQIEAAATTKPPLAEK
jgi:hypothetical protein